MITEKQRAALAAGRAKRLTRKKAEQYVKALKMNMRVKNADEKIVTYQNFEARIKYAQNEHFRLTGQKLSRTQAIKKVTLSTTFMSRTDLYKKAIVDYMSLGEKNSLRKLLSEVRGTSYKETTINWDEFYYNEGIKAIMNDQGVWVAIVPGKNSTDPDFIDMGRL